MSFRKIKGLHSIADLPSPDDPVSEVEDSPFTLGMVIPPIIMVKLEKNFLKKHPKLAAPVQVRVLFPGLSYFSAAIPQMSFR